MNKCGTCEFSNYNGTDFICNNEESEMYGLETDYDESCVDYKRKIGDSND